MPPLFIPLVFENGKLNVRKTTALADKMIQNHAEQYDKMIREQELAGISPATYK